MVNKKAGALEAPADGNFRLKAEATDQRAVKIFRRAPGAMRLVDRRFQLLILATVVSNSCAIEKSVSPLLTR